MGMKPNNSILDMPTNVPSIRTFVIGESTHTKLWTYYVDCESSGHISQTDKIHERVRTDVGKIYKASCEDMSVSADAWQSSTTSKIITFLEQLLPD